MSSPSPSWQARSCTESSCLCQYAFKPGWKSGVHMLLQLEEDAKGKLGGVARLGKRTLRPPEYAAGEGIEPVRRLTWRLVHGHACYYLSYTVLHRFALSQIAINGFPLCTRKHSVFQQVQPCLPGRHAGQDFVWA